MEGCIHDETYVLVSVSAKCVWLFGGVSVEILEDLVDFLLNGFPDDWWKDLNRKFCDYIFDFGTHHVDWGDTWITS